MLSMMKLILPILVLSLCLSCLCWDPDAGLVHGYQETAVVTATGHNIDNVPHYAVDNNEDTMWEGPWCNGCCTSLYMDFKTIKNVGWFYIRDSGTWVPFLNVSTSTDNSTWTPAFSHPMGNWRGQIYSLGFDTPARYVQVKGCSPAGGGKLQLKEIHVFDKYGRWGSTRSDSYINPMSFNDLLGINGIYQWGGAPNSPNVYSAIVSFARNYENIVWDLNNPNQKLNFSHFPTGQGDGGSWLNWDAEYGEWRATKNGVPGFKEVDASIQFTNDGAFQVANWKDPYMDGYNYAHEFARHFGPTNGNKLVKYFECGNEPWNFPADFYREVLAGFAAGSKAGDPKMLLMPGAFQADTPEYPTQYLTDGANYIGVRINETIAKDVDIINTHAYSYINGSDWLLATYPEDGRSSLNAIRNVVRWRDVNMPGKPVFLTEWGWDGASLFDNPPCFDGPWHKVCVSAEAKALYTIRGALKTARDGVEKAVLFFYANGDAYSPIYARSGLTSSKTTNFQKEPVYFAIQRFSALLGDLHHVGVVSETNEGYAYLLGSPSGVPTYLVAWFAVDVNVTTTSSLTIQKSTKWSINTSVPTLTKLGGLSQLSVPTSSVLQSVGNTYVIKVDKNLLVIPLQHTFDKPKFVLSSRN